MRKRIFIFGLSGLVIAVLLWWLLSGSTIQPPQSQMPPDADEPAKTVAATPLAQAVVSRSNDEFVSNLPPGVPAEVRSGVRNDLIERSYDEWRTPIEFYGKVVDENSVPVENARIDFGWNNLSGSPSRTGLSDKDGLFSLRGEQGKILVVKVNKEGYYPYKPHGAHFFYAGENENFVPDASSPVIFRLRKKGAGERLTKVKRNYPIPRDGTPVSVELSTGMTQTAETGDFVVQCWTKDQGTARGQKYDWHCVITIPGGGLVLTDEAFPFLAPETGYEPTAEIQMPADQSGWKSQVDLKFYYRLADGRYGRMTFSIIAGGQHFCMIDSLLNPSGSRNLEPNR